MLHPDNGELRNDLPPLAEFCNITRSFPPSTLALSDATFQIFPGDTVAVVGPSGSGKSTLLAILGLLETATRGTHRFLGQDVSRFRDRERTRVRREHIGFVFQAFHLIPHLTALENVQYGATSLDRRRSVRRLAASSLEDVGLAHRSDAFPTTMSGGEQQRIAIARALVRKPQLLLCDEPTGNLDSRTSQKVLDLLVSHQRADTALVIITHDATVASACSRKLYVLDGYVTERQ